jgi:predicted PurR-regulated permease PerM
MITTYIWTSIALGVAAGIVLAILIRLLIEEFQEHGHDLPDILTVSLGTFVYLLYIAIILGCSYMVASTAIEEAKEQAVQEYREERTAVPDVKQPPKIFRPGSEPDHQ